jgi:hypothetical protein
MEKRKIVRRSWNGWAVPNSESASWYVALFGKKDLSATTGGVKTVLT